MTTNTLTKVSFTINGEQLKEMKAAIKGLKHNKMFSMLENVRLTIENNQLMFEAQDAMNYIQMTFPTDNNSTGQLSLNKKVIKDLKLKKNDIAEVEILDNSSFTITLNGLTLTHNQAESANFVNEFTGEEDTFTTNENYISSLKNSLKFVAQTETRPTLQGICHRDGNLTCTDSHQLYQNENMHSLENGYITVHHQTAKIVTEVYKKCNDLTFKISTNEKFIKYEGNNTVVVGKLIDGNFPVTKNMIPQYSKTDIALNTNEVEQLINTFKTMLSQNSGKNKVIHFVIEKEELKAYTLTDSRIEQVFNNIVTSGEPLKIAFNGKNLLNALEQQKGNNIVIKFTGAVSPFLVTAETKEIYLYSPVRTY